MKGQIGNPYLRATFNFLCSSGRDGFSSVLVSGEGVRGGRCGGVRGEG